MIKKKKSITLKAQKPSRRSFAKAFKVEEPMEEFNNEEDLNNEEEEEEFSFISKNIQSMWKKKRNTHFRGRHIGFTSINEHKDKNKEGLVICYECKKPKHFKYECPNLEKSKKTVFQRR